MERFGWRFQMGDKIIQTENDYDKEVFNGDIGTVEQIDPVEHQVVVSYDDRMVKYDFGELDEVAPAYACDHPQVAGIGISSGRDSAGHATLHAAATELDIYGDYTGQKAGGADRSEKGAGHCRS